MDIALRNTKPLHNLVFTYCTASIYYTAINSGLKFIIKDVVKGIFEVKKSEKIIYTKLDTFAELLSLNYAQTMCLHKCKDNAILIDSLTVEYADKITVDSCVDVFKTNHKDLHCTLCLVRADDTIVFMFAIHHDSHLVCLLNISEAEVMIRSLYQTYASCILTEVSFYC